MAAAYQTGTSTGPIDLVQKIVTFLVAQGWTSDSSVTYGSGWRAHLHKGSQYVNMRAIVNEAANASTVWGTGSGAVATAGYGIALYLGDGYNGANAFNNQTGGPKDSGGTNPVGAGMYMGSGSVPAYYFFDDGADHITVVIDRGNGLYAHMGWGPTLTKTGYTADHWYFYASSPHTYNVAVPGSGGPFPGMDLSAAAPMAHAFTTGGFMYALAFVRTDAAVFTNRWLGLRSNSGTIAQYGYTGRQGRCSLDITGSLGSTAEYPRTNAFLTRGWQSAFPGALLVPQQIFAEAATARWIPLGYPPTVFMCQAVGHGHNPAQVYQVGGLDYMVFPGFAVRKAA
jgi:hypothetical protein